ncbi:helix-turn-helix transcriptional regulator [Oscillospiraceae bacterium PP1C4]
MTFGEKLQLIRKLKGMSQEQLAAQITVSRQAISKWELNTSLPDTENILQISKLFGVSTDYLLNDEIESDMDIPAVRAKESTMKSEYHNRMIFAGTIGIMIVGLLLSVGAWLTWQIPPPAVIGIIVQIVGITIFEMLISKSNNEVLKMERIKFYSISPWIILPFPMKFLVDDLLFWLYPRPYGYFLNAIMIAFAYLFVCGYTTFLLNRKKQSSNLNLTK